MALPTGSRPDHDDVVVLGHGDCFAQARVVLCWARSGALPSPRAAV
jgi:hypothetical protein